MAKTIRHLPGGGVAAPDEKPLRYVALHAFRLGERFTEAGEELTATQLEDRDVEAMLRDRLIQQHIKPVARARRKATSR